MFKIVSLLLLVVLVSFNCSAFYLESDEENRKVSGWEHVFAYNISSVIPLHHYGPKSYYLGIGVKAKYMQAMQFCDNIHMKLLTIRSREENDRIQKYIREANKGSDDFWTSGSKLLDGRNWVWMSHGDGIQYTNWAPGEPNDDRSQCIRLSSKHGELYWHDSRCDESRFFICERYSASEDVTGVDTEPTITGWMQMLTGASSNIGLLHYNNKRYFFARNFKTNYLQAIQFCNIIKMELVTISSAEENDRIYKYIRDINGGTDWWTSGTKLLDSKTWIWLTKGSHVEYTNWLPGQPDGNDELCLQLVQQKDKGLFWKDSRCSETCHFICETTCDNDDCADGGTYNVGRSQGGNVKAIRTTTAIPKRKYTSTPLLAEEESMNDDEWKYKITMTSSGSISYDYVEGHKYHMEIDLIATQAQAEIYCEYHNMQLISIFNKEDNDRIKLLMIDSSVPGPFWTSGRKIDSVWTWPIGSQQLSYANWARDQPSFKTDKKCIEIDHDGEWLDENCYERRHFICEMPTGPRSGNIADSRKISVSQCSTEPVINVYISNNVITENGREEVSQSFLTSKDVEISETGYHVHVSNNIETPGSEKNNEI
ncbi:unnamed protein product [Phaedon cochleariae]|uniref:C-type lectin domain-containing protein n=1 Tax=Phaedon cochleariae TaxID=80249 RepID=A0A9P0DM37_PHACE|nr:unnamed protein product [Phaedon cochleariae]